VILLCSNFQNCELRYCVTDTLSENHKSLIGKIFEKPMEIRCLYISLQNLLKAYQQKKNYKVVFLKRKNKKKPISRLE